MTKFDEAVSFACRVHSDMTRKNEKTPYILHPLEAAVIAGTIMCDEDLLCAAVLHDVVEDTSATIEEVEALFGEGVATLVASETEDKRPGIPSEASWKVRKEESVEVVRKAADKRVKALYIADKLSNIRSFLRQYEKIGDEMWKYYNMKDKQQHKWYYNAILDATSEFSDTTAWKEMRMIVDYLFREEKNENS